MGAEGVHPLLATDEPGAVDNFRIHLVAGDGRGQNRAGWARVIHRSVSRAALNGEMVRVLFKSA